LAASTWAAGASPAPAHPDVERVRTAKTLFFDRKYAEARQAWEAVRAAKGPDAETAAYWVARCSENLGESDRALKEYDAFLALGPKDRALVDEGFIDVGMNTNAVYIAWGKPYEIMRVDFPSGERTVWVYTGAVSEPVSTWQYRPSSSPYSARRGSYEPTTTTILRRRTNGWVSFENGAVVSFDSYAPSRAH